MTMEHFKGELVRSCNVLSADNADIQNCTDIKGWLDDGYIDKSQATALKGINRKLYKEYCK